MHQLYLDFSGKLGLDLVPRIGPLAVNPHIVSIVSLHKIHENSAENAKASSSRGTLRRKATKNILSHHLYLCMRDFGHRIGDDVEIYFFLYDAYPSRMRALSERFLVKISKDGFSNYVEKLHSNCTVFTDLGAAELSNDLHLVAHVMRVGKIIHSESIKKGDKAIVSQSHRRPYGVGILPLNEICHLDSTVETEEKEFTFKIFQCEEKDFHQLHELIIKKASGKFSPLNTGGQSNYGIVVSMKLLHGGLLQARQEQPTLFQGASITRKMGFPDVIMPGDVRNDMFITLERGEFERGGKSTAKNIEVSVTILDNMGKILPEYLYGASGMEAVNSYKSTILYHQNSPCWNETLRLSVPIDKFSTAHVRFEFRHCSTREKSEPKLFGFSFARLMEPSGATLSDGIHELYVYKCEDISKIASVSYLKLPCKPKDSQAQQESNTLFHKSAKEMFTIKSLLCSTKLTQNNDLLSLLQWRTHPEKIEESLSAVSRLHDEELIKFLQDVLDALFAMFSNEDGNSTKHSGTVFHVLVSILYLLRSNKFQHFKPVMDEYIEKHFAAALVYKGLIMSVDHLAKNMTKADRPDPLQKCFGSLEYIFKLIIQSRKLFARATGGQYEDSFRKDLHTLFCSLNGMFSVPSYDIVLPTQEALLNSIGVVLEQLKGTLPPPELGMLARNMLDSIPVDSQPRLIQAKLQAVRDFVSGQLFQDDESRSAILAVACKHLRIHLARRDELRLCAEILSEILTHLYQARQKQQEKLSNTLQHDLDSLCKSCLDILMQTIIIIMDGATSILSPLVAVLLGLLELLDESHYKCLWDEISVSADMKELKDFLHRSLLVFKELLTHDWQVFPNDWLVMKLAANDVIRKSLEEFAKPLVYRFLGHLTFDANLWWTYFSLAVSFLTQPCLQLEQYHEQKRRKILHSHGDMRVLMGFQILSMWSQLGEHKLHFIPSMVGPFLEVTLVPEPALRKATLAVFYDMMQCEQMSRGSFRLVERELIDKLDLLISENKGDDEYKELFSTMEHLSLVLLEKVQSEDPAWRESGAAFISSVTRLLERLLDYRSVMQGDENRDKRMSCTVNLLNFYKNEINRKEMYLRYIYKLHDLHLQAENYTEAGFTLKLYADMLSWDKETLTYAPNDNNFQPEWHRKEMLYHEILKYFDKGKCWEKGIPLCKELANLYETKRFDYNKLSDILIKQAKFFQNILTQLRPEPEYFRVGFYGTGFPLFVRNKQFVYRGLEYERIGTFTQRLQTEFPQAQILTKNSPPDKSILSAPEQYIQISNVRPIGDPKALKSAMVPVPEKIARFYEVNDVTRFIHDRPIYKGPVDKENEFKSLWIERTTLDIASPLPGILRWFEVISKSHQELTPVEFACETMENVGKELWDLVIQYKTDPKRNINPFSMRLQGIIDANVMGGISKYQEAFFNEQFLKTPLGQNQHANVQRLKSLILEQIQVLDTALELHGRLAPAGVQPLHSRLIERFSQLKQSLSCLDKLKRQFSESIVNTPLPPLPIDKRTLSLGSSYVYEQDDIYTRPVEAREYHATDSLRYQEPIRRDDLKLIGLSNEMNAPVPPVPLRPRSTGFIGTMESPETPPKVGFREKPGSPKAPPLPPRGLTPDKRASNPIPFSEYAERKGSNGSICLPSKQPRGPQKYAVVDISFDDPEADYNHHHHNMQMENLLDICHPPNDYRDSGISTSSNEFQAMNNFNMMDDLSIRENFKNNPQSDIMNIIQSQDVDIQPPPIPPKAMNVGVSNESINTERISPGVVQYNGIDKACIPRNTSENDAPESQ
ncbi:unnamed protein product [Hermetia illucens]|uniref:Dedicator of cytokinesis protein 3 n=1 Tax=Hermetia illucens TaxID=343691 RepID=A0A7R8V3H6_HERIL|nr:unnamed protein product [Hermetia illucens]